MGEPIDWTLFLQIVLLIILLALLASSVIDDIAQMRAKSNRKEES